MFTTVIAVALAACTLASSVDSRNEVYGDIPKMTPVPFGERVSSPSIDTASPQEVGVAHSLQSVELVFALENGAVVDQTYTAKARNYIETAFDNARNLRRTKTMNNDHYKGPGWWAVLWTAAYYLTKDWKYVEEAEILLENMNEHWGNSCGSGSRCRLTHAYIRAPLSELALSLARFIQRMSSGSWPNLDRATVKHDDAVLPKAPANVDKNVLKERRMKDCSDSSEPAPESEAKFVGGVVELCLQSSMMLNEVHALARAYMANTIARPGPNDAEFNTAGCEFQFKKVFAGGQQKLQQALRNERYQKLLENDLNSISRQANTDVYGSASWVGPCFPLSSASRQWVCWALVLL